jgi:hypothetical protein
MIPNGPSGAIAKLAELIGKDMGHFKVTFAWKYGEKQ